MGVIFSQDKILPDVDNAEVVTKIMMMGFDGAVFSIEPLTTSFFQTTTSNDCRDYCIYNITVSLDLCAYA